MNWRCAIGIHDWEVKRGDYKTEVLDRKHKLHGVVIHNHGTPESRICRRCDKRQRHWSDMHGSGWETLLPFEEIQDRFPHNVGFLSSDSIQQAMDEGHYRKQE